MSKQKQVKLISSQSSRYLTKGNTYPVIKEDSFYYLLLDDHGIERYFGKDRFVEVGEPSLQQEIEYYEVIKKVPLSGYKPGAKLHTINMFAEYAQYPEFFKPHYKAQYKAGDWITVDHIHWEFGVIQLTGVDEYGFKSKEHKYWSKTSDFGKNTRHATAEEIEAASAITIAGYKVEIDKNGYVKIGCKNFTKSEIIAYKRLLDNGVTIIYKEEEITLDKLNQIIDKLK